MFEADLEGAEFRAGALKGLWGVADADVVPGDLTWPNVCFWLKAAPRENAPDRYYVMVDLSGYRKASPTGTFWDPANKRRLDLAHFPKGRANSRFAKVFRTDWENGKAFYHPYDRFAAEGHSGWPTEQPHLIWTEDRTIVDYLEEFQSLLTTEDYLGV